MGSMLSSPAPEAQHGTRRLRPALLGPVLVRLPPLALHQLGDHHDDRHLDGDHGGPYLLLDHHVPEVLEGCLLGSLGSYEHLGAVWEHNLAGIHKSCLWAREQIR